MKKLTIPQLLELLEKEINSVMLDNDNLKLQNDELLSALKKYTQCAKDNECPDKPK